MKYVMLFGSASEDVWTNLPTGRADEVMAEIMQWWGMHAGSGTIVSGERLQPGVTATTIRLGGSRPELTDGPFIEAKEEVSGYGVIEVADLDAAIALAQTWPALKVPGECVEVRPVFAM